MIEKVTLFVIAALLLAVLYLLAFAERLFGKGG